MDILEVDYYEYQDANGSPLKDELIHEYVRFYFEILTCQTCCCSACGSNIAVHIKQFCSTTVRFSLRTNRYVA